MFVDDVLGRRLIQTIFKDTIREFVTDYIELSRYSKDVSKYFSKSLWDFPQDPSHFENIHAIISKSKNNYEKHKLNHPDLAIFDDDYE